MITKSASVLLTLATLTSLQTIAAQGGQGPLPVAGAAFAKNSVTNKFFVLGGQYNNSPIGQFWSLDLAAAWNTTQPAWQQLADGPIQNIFPAVFSADGKTMATFHTGGTTFAFRYTVATNTWKQSQLTATYAGYQGVSAVTDPNTGLVYLPGSYTDASRNSMNVYNFDSDTMVQVALPSASSIFPNRAYYSIAWSQKRMSALIFGGYNATLGSIPGGYDTVTEFVPASGAWANVTTTGVGPSSRADTCMTSNDDGSLVIVYGGRPYNNAPFSGEVFILDTVAKAWRQGTPGPVRVYTTCVIAGDQLLIWGGADQTTAAPATIYIYNISNNTWVSQYTPPASYLVPKSTPSGDSSGGSGSSNAGAIAGGVVGGLAVICAIVLFVLYKRRRHAAGYSSGNSDDDNEGKPSSSSAPAPASANVMTREEEEIYQMRVQLQNQQEQLDLQRRLLHLQQEQQQLSGPQYNYQPPTFYSTSGVSGPVYVIPSGSIAASSPDAFQTSSIAGYNSGYMDEGGTYSDLNHHSPVVTPVVYSPPGVTVAAVQLPSGPSASGPQPILARSKQDDQFWEERVPGNPHAVIE
ncbi:hypothetical protein CPC16_012227 [Podila verticillata]|nr:hypothetical protein CPC16_012227 [Podila verticillata]